MKHLAIALLLLASCSDGGRASRGGEPPRHALLVTVAGLRTDHLSFSLYPLPTTYRHHTQDERLRGSDLSLDAVAASGVLFADAFAPAGNQAASLASILGGRHALSTGVLSPEDELPADVETLAESFRAAGFRTGAFASGFRLEPEAGLGRGFEVVRSLDGPPGNEDAIREACMWFGGLDADERSFAWVHLQGTDARHRRGEIDVATYDADMAELGDSLSGFFEYLAGLSEGQPTDRLSDTALILTASNGFELGEHDGYQGHRASLYDAVLHVPLVLRHPRSLTGKRVLSDLVEVDRVAATLSDWLDLEDERPFRSLLLLADGHSSPSDATALGLRGREAFTLRTPSWRLQWMPRAEGDDPEHRLFDVVADPRELNDLAGNEPEVVRALTERLVERLEREGQCFSSAELSELRVLAEGTP